MTSGLAFEEASPLSEEKGLRRDGSRRPLKFDAPYNPSRILTLGLTGLQNALVGVRPQGRIFSN